MLQPQELSGQTMITTVAMMGDNTNNNTQSIADYLAQLLKDKKQLTAFPNVFVHLERLLDDGKKFSDAIARIFTFFSLAKSVGTQVDSSIERLCWARSEVCSKVWVSTQSHTNTGAEGNVKRSCTGSHIWPI